VFTYVTLREPTVVVKDQCGENIQNFKLFGLSGNSQICIESVRLVNEIRAGMILERGGGGTIFV
jgi:hypothetical protein